MRAQRQLSNGSNDLSSVFERLASGQRINRASDDAAGLAIADTLNADTRVYTQGIRNLNDGLSVLNIADGALQELTNITLRLTELAEQAANGTLGSAQRAALDEEAQALKAEYFRISRSTEFNGRKLFDGEYGELSLQAGYGSTGSLGDGLGGAIGTGDFEAMIGNATPDTVYYFDAGDLNGDGYLDFSYIDATTFDVNILLGSGTGTFTASSSFSRGATTNDIELADLNNDGVLDIVAASLTDFTVYLGNGDGTFQSGVTTNVTAGGFVTTGDINGDGVQDVISSASSGNTYFTVALGNGDGTFASTTTFSTTLQISRMLLSDFDGDGVLDLAGASGLGLAVYTGSGDGTFSDEQNVLTGTNQVLALTDYDLDGDIDVVGTSSSFSLIYLYDNNGGAFTYAGSEATLSTRLSLTTGDFNGDGVDDIATGGIGDIAIHLGNGDGTYQEYESLTGNDSIFLIAEDYNNDGVLDLAGSRATHDSIGVFIATTQDGVAPLLDFSLATIADAKQALSRFQQKLSHLAEQRGQIGAFQSRIEVAKNVLGVSVENFKAAESRIRDADIAQESANLVRLQILQQASAAVLAQANQQPQLVLGLLEAGT